MNELFEVILAKMCVGDADLSSWEENACGGVLGKFNFSLGKENGGQTPSDLVSRTRSLFQKLKSFNQPYDDSRLWKATANL